MSIPETVRDILARSIITETTLKLPEQLDRADYLATEKVLKIAGGKWNRARRVHVFPSDPRALLGMAVESGTITDKRAELQAFYTPPELADLVAEYADVQRGETVLEPSAGAGALVDAVRRYCPDVGEITTVDIDPAVQATIVGDFLKLADYINVHDVVVMNPPFAKGQAVAHVKVALPCARRRLVAIMPPTWQTSARKADCELVNMLENCRAYSVVTLPEGAFKASGTMVRTVLLVVDK